MNTVWPIDSFQEFFQSIALDSQNTIEGNVLQTVDKILMSLFEVSTFVKRDQVTALVTAADSTKEPG